MGYSPAAAAAAAKSLQSCPTLCDPSRQPTRLHHPWDSPGKNTGVGCHLLVHRVAKSRTRLSNFTFIVMLKVLFGCFYLFLMWEHPSVGCESSILGGRVAFGMVSATVFLRLC